MIFGVPLWLGMLLSACDIMLVIYLQRAGLSRFEVFVEGLLFILAGCIMYVLIISNPSLATIENGALVPSFWRPSHQGCSTRGHYNGQSHHVAKPLPLQLDRKGRPKSGQIHTRITHHPIGITLKYIHWPSVHMRLTTSM